MGKDSHEIRREIERTRDRMGDTVEAIGYKADVPSRVKESISNKVDAVKESISGKVDSVRSKVSGIGSRVSGAVPDSGDVRRSAGRIVDMASDNPLGLVIGGFAAGFLLGLLMPATRMETERIAPLAGQVKEKARDAGQEIIDHGKQVMRDVAQTAKDSSQRHGQEIASSVKEHARDLGSSVRADGGRALEPS
jgi:gas vesicle protein